MRSVAAPAGDKLGDYECRAWNNYMNSNAVVTKTPVCEPGHTVPCSWFSGTKADCATLGGPSNPTNMTCRDPLTGKVLSAQDPNGYCLDDTASGP